MVAVADAVKPEARTVVAALHRMGMRVWMITGDTRCVGGRRRVGGRVRGREGGVCTVLAALHRMGMRVWMITGTPGAEDLGKIQADPRCSTQRRGQGLPTSTLP